MLLPESATTGERALLGRTDLASSRVGHSVAVRFSFIDSSAEEGGGGGGEGFKRLFTTDTHSNESGKQFEGVEGGGG